MNSQECVKKCSINEMNEKLCIENYMNSQNENSDKNLNIEKEEIMNKALIYFEEEMTSEGFDTSIFDKGGTVSINIGTSKIEIYSLKNQSNINNNLTSVHLGKCEDILRKKYNIPNNEDIYMKKIDFIQLYINITKVKFDVYSRLNGTNLVKLDLSLCENNKINILIHAPLTDNIDILNKSSSYYNDICYVASSDKGTDLIIRDRIKESIKNNKTLCQEGCDFTDYNYELLIANCSCSVKESSSYVEKRNIDMKKVFEALKDVKNIANINIFVCYEVLFSIKGISKNIGAILIIIIIIFHFICIILFYVKFYNEIIRLIDNIIFGTKNWKLVKDEKKEKKIKDESKIKGKGKNSEKNLDVKPYKNITKVKNKKDKIRIIPPLYFQIENQKSLIYRKNDYPSIQKNGIINININYINQNYNNNLIIMKNNQKKETNAGKDESIYQLKEEKSEKKIEKIKSIMAYNNEELNKLSYNLALKYDKRTYCEYYISLLKSKHNLIFPFCNEKDYNSKLIKINLFFIGFVIYLFDNVLSFTDDTKHEIYENEGHYNFLNQLPKIIYSTLISLILNTILKFFALSEREISSFKTNKLITNLNQRQEKLKNQLKIKFIIYFIISSILLLFFWYYISMFCAIYKNTQIHLISDALISYGLSLIYPLGYYLLPGLFRIPALSNPKNKKIYLYTISIILQMI